MKAHSLSTDHGDSGGIGGLRARKARSGVFDARGPQKLRLLECGRQGSDTGVIYGFKTFHLKGHMVCLSVILLCYRIPH